MSRRGLTAVAAVLVGVLLIPLPLIDADRYTAVAAGVQAAGVVLTLAYAAATLRADSHGRRTDRILDLHLTFITGEVGNARQRLTQHLRDHGRRQVVPVTIAELRDRHRLGIYEADDAHRPYQDLSSLLRFFERTWGVLGAGALDEDLLHRLVGPHAIWWDRAIADDPVHSNGPTLAALRELAAWVRERAGRRGLDDWTALVDRDFREGAFSDQFEGRLSGGP